MAEEMEKATLDQLCQNVQELTTTIKDHKADPATLDQDTLVEAFKAAQATMVADTTPVRLGADAVLVGPEGGKVVDPIVKDGKFAGQRAGDLAFVASFLNLAAKQAKQVKPPSPELMKALTSTGSGTGDELVPTAFAAELWQDIFAASLVKGALGPAIAMPSDPFEEPLGLGSITFYKGTQNTATTATDMATTKSTMTTTEQVGEVNWSYTLDEDAVIAMLPALRAQIQIDAAENMDAFILNADGETGATGNVNLDDAAPDAGNYYMSEGQNGVRHQWIADNTDQSINAGGDALSDTDVLNALKVMGKYIGRPGQCVMVCDFSTYIKGFMNLDGVQTLDKYGPAAVLLTGELARYRGIPVIPSSSHPLAEADGKVSTTAGNNTLGSLSIFHRAMWHVGFRRELLFEVDKDIQKRQLIMVISYRIAVTTHGTRSSNTHTAGVRNILVT